MSSPTTSEARAPGKVILFGEHAVNRGQPAVAASVGLYARCRVTRAGEGFSFRSGLQAETTTRFALVCAAREIDLWRREEDYEAIRRMAREDFFAPQKYVLAALFGDDLPDGLDLEWESEIPPSSGLGSGGAAFAALVAAVAPLLPSRPSPDELARAAQLGDVVAHGGVASGLDTQTSLLGGVIYYTGKGLAEPVAVAANLPLVIGHTGVHAPTSEVNARVRIWLAERPESRMAYFRTVGALTRAALPLFARGDWDELGRLFTLNQLALEKIGVSGPEIEALIDAALAAGAYGAKLSGSGGGGIIVAIAPPEQREAVAAAITQAGGRAYVPEIAVPGALGAG